jgi:DNA-binding NarL/FixJ family response regulator
MVRPRILLADDHRIFVEGLRSMLAADFDLLAIAEDGHAMIEIARILRPDLIVADVAMPRLNGIEAFLQLRAEMPSIKVVFLTMHEEVVFARRALEAGAMGYVLKHAAFAELMAAMRTALAGNIYIAPTLTADVLRALRERPQGGGKPAALLTPRQREILQLLVEGRSAKEIAKSLYISARTVEFHKYQMMETLELHNNTELVLFAIKNHLVAV